MNVEDNPYKDDYYRCITGCIEDCPLDNFFEYQKMMANKKQESLKEALSLLAEYMPDLWY